MHMFIRNLYTYSVLYRIYYSVITNHKYIAKYSLFQPSILYNIQRNVNEISTLTAWVVINIINETLPI